MVGQLTLFRTISALWLAGIAFVAADAAKLVRLQGKFPESSATMDVDMRGTVAEALQQLATKNGWALAASAPTLDQRISLKTAKRPVRETLELVLEAGDLQARLDGTTLVVKAYRKDAAANEEEDESDDDGEDESLVQPPDPPDLPDSPERTAYGEDLVVEKGETLDDVVVQGGDLIVRGRVRGDAASMGGDIIVEDGGVIAGDAAAMGGDVVIKKGGAIKGSISKVGGGFGKVFKNLAKRAAPPQQHSSGSDDDDDSVLGFLFFLTVFASIAAFVISVILIAFVPERIERISSMLEDKPMQSAAGGIAMLVGFFPFCVLLAVSVVGLALVPLAFVSLVMLYVAGYTSVSVLLGRKLPFFAGRKTLLGAMGLGLATLTLLALIPWFGSFVVFVITTIGAGAVVLSRFGTPPKIVDVA